MPACLQPGQFANASGLTACSSCAPGRAQSAAAQGDCLLCEPGACDDRSASPNARLLVPWLPVCAHSSWLLPATITGCVWCSRRQVQPVLWALRLHRLRRRHLPSGLVRVTAWCSFLPLMCRYGWPLRPPTCLTLPSRAPLCAFSSSLLQGRGQRLRQVPGRLVPDVQARHAVRPVQAG